MDKEKSLALPNYYAEVEREIRGLDATREGNVLSKLETRMKSIEDRDYVVPLAGLNGICGFKMISQPNKTVVSFIGSNQTFSWSFKLTEGEKSKKLEVVLASWNKKYDYITGDHSVTYVRESNGSESVVKDKEALIARRLNWVGDLARGFVAFQLLNVQQQDTSDYGIRFQVSGSHPMEDGFTLSAQVPTPPPTKPPEPENITVEMKEGELLNITCRARMGPENSSVMWLKDNRPMKKGRNSFLVIQSINRSQAGKYMCVSLSQDRNYSSPFTAVDVLYKPRILKPRKQLTLELTRGNSTMLECTADANPFPIFTWHTEGGDIKQGFSNTSNSSYLAVTPINDSYVKNYMYKCVASNKLGFDSVTFTLIEKRKYCDSLVTNSFNHGYCIPGPGYWST
ncbi:protein amalgam-like [Stylophora pistillata]|uniref:protein amalgam-like n=1 Tax=Stylophora pistillata TaxID=50429 RepID=UPI000C0486FC|nr:protein amalgam-like [Stylophora pistillata]